METDPTSVKNVVIFPVMETDYLTPLITVCSETPTQKNVFPLQWTMWYFFSVMETNYSTRLITVCSETSIQQRNITMSVNNVVIFSVMDTDPTSVKNVVLFFSYGDRLLNPFNYCMQWNLNPTKNGFPLQWTMWYFFSVLKTVPTSVNNVGMRHTQVHRCL